MGNGTYGQVYKVRNFHFIFVNNHFSIIFVCTSWFPYAWGPVWLPIQLCVTRSPLTFIRMEESCINGLLNILFFFFFVPRKKVLQGEVDFWVNFPCSPEMSWGSPDRVLNSSVRPGPCTAHQNSMWPQSCSMLRNQDICWGGGGGGKNEERGGHEIVGEAVEEER